MLTRLLLALLIAVAQLTLASSTFAALHTGVVGFPLTGGGWDFSDSLDASPASGADVIYGVIARAEERAAASTMTDILLAISPAVITFIGSADSTYENLNAAPTDPGLYESSVVARPYDVFVVKTREGHYAKIRILLPSGGLFRLEYTYQDDGSPSFVPGVAVRSTTWGRIKALYRQ